MVPNFQGKVVSIPTGVYFTSGYTTFISDVTKIWQSPQQTVLVEHTLALPRIDYAVFAQCGGSMMSCKIRKGVPAASPVVVDTALETDDMFIALIYVPANYNGTTDVGIRNVIEGGTTMTPWGYSLPVMPTEFAEKLKQGTEVWVPGKFYLKDMIATESENIYFSKRAHISTTNFITDKNNQLWSVNTNQSATTAKTSVTWTGVTTDAIETELFVNGFSPSRLAVPANSVMGLTITVLGWDNVDKLSHYEILHVKIKRDALGVVTYTALVDQNSADDTWSINIAADNTNKGLSVKVTGDAVNPVTWLVAADYIMISS